MKLPKLPKPKKILKILQIMKRKEVSLNKMKKRTEVGELEQ